MTFTGAHSWEVLEVVPAEVMTRVPSSWAAKSRAPLPPGVQPVTPRFAATLVLVREGTDEGLEVWLMRRSGGMKFAGVWAFPGGKVEPVDEQQPDPLLACVLRECREETGLDLAASRPIPWARWITPDTSPYRFDTWFFVLPVPDGLEPQNTSSEADLVDWQSPEAVLAEDRAAADGAVTLLPPTRSVLTELALLGSLARLREAAAQRVIEPVSPRLVRDGAGWRASHPRRDGSWT